MEQVDTCIASLLWASQNKTTDACSICIMHLLINGFLESGNDFTVSVLSRREAKPSRLLLYALHSCVEADLENTVFRGDVESCETDEDENNLKIIHVQARWNAEVARQLIALTANNG